MNNEDKQSHNLERLTTNRTTEYIYVPVQFGNLSQSQRRVKVIETVEITDGNSKRIYKLLEIAEKNVGEGRRLIWWHKKIGKDKKGRYFEFTFEKYSKEAWEKIKKEADESVSDDVSESDRETRGRRRNVRNTENRTERVLT